MNPDTMADTLIRATVQGSVTLLAVFALVTVWQRCPHHVRCWLWRIALLKMIIAAIWISPVTFAVLPRRVQPVRNVLAVKPTPPAQQSYTSVKIGETVEHSAQSADNFRPTPAKPELPEPPRATAREVLSRLWWLGVAASTAGVLVSFIGSKRLRAKCSHVDDPEILSELTSLCNQAGLRRVPELLLSQHAGPLVVGLAKPAIILPQSALVPGHFEETRLILAHEIAHISRRDLLWEILPALAQVAFFFNPLVYLARYQTSLAREMACDALALKLTGASDSRYAKMLVDCVPGGRASVSSVGMAEAYGVLRARILSVANPILVSRPRLAVIWTLTAVVAITVIVPWMLTSERLQSSRRDLKPYRDSYDGLSIIPGEYKLNWELRDPEMRSSSRPTLVDSNMRAKIRGRLSSRAYHFDQDGFEAVIDQSHDSSKGYDVAYIFPEKWLHRGNVDLSATWRIPLLYEGTGPANDGFPVDLKLGRNTESTKKSGEFAIEAEIGPDGKPSEATLVWKGGWYGKVRTTKGEYEVEARDEDRDGRYNGTDSWECTPCNGCRHGLDQFQFADITTDSGSNSWFGESSEPALGVGMFAGKLYSFKVSSAGDSVYIEDYSGETGTIRLRSVDGFGRPAGFSAIFSGKNSKFVFSGRGKRDVEIPPGKYEVQVQVGVPDIHTKPDLANYYNNPFTYEYNSVKVTTGGTTPVNVGGKLTLEAFTNNRSFTTKHGVRKLMYVRLRAPQANNIFATWGPVKPISVRVLDRGGKAVQTSEMEWSGGFCTLTGQLDIGIFKPGDYTMVASYDFSPYSPEATVTAKIRVTE